MVSCFHLPSLCEKIPNISFHLSSFNRFFTIIGEVQRLVYTFLFDYVSPNNETLTYIFLFSSPSLPTSPSSAVCAHHLQQHRPRSNPHYRMVISSFFHSEPSFWRYYPRSMCSACSPHTLRSQLCFEVWTLRLATQSAYLCFLISISSDQFSLHSTFYLTLLQLKSLHLPLLMLN